MFEKYTRKYLNKRAQAPRPLTGEEITAVARLVGAKIQETIENLVDERLPRVLDQRLEDFAARRRMKEVVDVQIRFAGSGPDVKFVEIEYPTGRSIRLGRWERDAASIGPLGSGEPEYLLKFRACAEDIQAIFAAPQRKVPSEDHTRGL